MPVRNLKLRAPAPLEATYAKHLPRQFGQGVPLQALCKNKDDEEKEEEGIALDRVSERPKRPRMRQGRRYRWKT